MSTHRATVKLKDAPFGAESLFVADPEARNGTIQAVSENCCFFVRIGIGDVLELAERDGRWQVTKILARHPKNISWQIFLVSEEELEQIGPPDAEEGSARAKAFDADLRRLAEDALPYINVEGALGMAPLLNVTAIDAPDEIVTLIEYALTEIENEGRITVYNHTEPSDDLLDPETYDGIDFTELEPVPSVETTYRAEDDPWWAEKYGPDEHTLRGVHFQINSLARSDSRVARDLEAGIHERVDILFTRLNTPPDELVPLDGPLWPEEN
jgi:hypothetical protein